MPKLSIIPYNDMGEVVKRGASSINSRATRKEIAAKVLASANREGVGNIRTVDVLAADGTHISSWDIRNYGLTAVQTDGEGSMVFENSIFNMEGMTMNTEVETADAEAKIAADLAAKQEAAALAKAEKERLKAEKLAAKELEKTARAEKAAEAKAAKEALKAEKAAEREAKKLERAAAKTTTAKPRRAFAETKKGQVLQMIKDGNGVVATMAAHFGPDMGETATRSLIADLKHMGYEFTTHRDAETKVLKYVLSSEPEAAEDPKPKSNEVDGEEDAEDGQETEGSEEEGSESETEEETAAA